MKLQKVPDVRHCYQCNFIKPGIQAPEPAPIRCRDAIFLADVLKW